MHKIGICTVFVTYTGLKLEIATVYIMVGSVAERVKAPFLWRPCDHDCV